MWQLSQPQLKPAMLNLAGSDRGQARVTQLWHQNIRLINAIERVNWDDTDANFQFELCACGYVGCRSQGWVSLRRLGAMALILPAFSKIAQASQALKNEYLPPAYLSGGNIWIDQSDYGELRGVSRLDGVATFPDFPHLPALTPWEVAKLLQWEAPHRVLGNIHDSPKLPADLVIASSEGSFLDQVPIFSALLSRFLDSVSRVTIRPINPQEQVISFYLDLAGIPQWPALAYDGVVYRLYLQPGYTISPCT